MTRAELQEWLRGQQESLDEMIESAARKFWSERNDAVNFGYDLAQCQAESYNLFDGHDLCYDRPNTPLTYSLWYHGRRVNTFLSHFADTILQTQQSVIDIFDLGAGTSAVQWGIGLVYARLKEAKIQVPRIRIVNVDTSPFMLYYGRDYLWAEFLKRYPACSDIVVDYEINSWNNRTEREISGPWIIASYLFDVSDTYKGETFKDYRESVKTAFAELIRNFNPAHIFLLTSSQDSKLRLLDEISGEVRRSGYIFRQVKDESLVFDGDLRRVSGFRKELSGKYSSDLSGLEPRYRDSLSKTTSWVEGKFTAHILSRQQAGLSLEARRNDTQAITLGNGPIKVRKDVKLSSDQIKASEHSDRPTVIQGPAGCGKSVVLTERVRNLVRESGFSEKLDILVTTFNKDLLGQLIVWIEDLLNSVDRTKVRRMGHVFYFQDSTSPNITCQHIDTLPPRIGKGLNRSDIGFREYHEPLVEECIREVKKERGINTVEYDKVLNVQYVLDEYHRVIYGLQVSSREEYLKAERRGRPKLKISGIRRELLWDVIVEKYLKRIQKQSFTSKRDRLLEQIKNGEVTKKYTHIFLDEFQDCTDADYSILYGLLENPNNLVIAGDIAQAIQLGSVANIPRSTDEEMQRRVFHRLKGSYRVPFRISECIAGISASIENGDVIAPYKGAPPGARPIVVYAPTLEAMAVKVKIIFENYGVYGCDKVHILEPDTELSIALTACGVANEAHRILKIKGMERDCVLWSTRRDIEYKYEVEEFVHTTMTRTTGVLIIALFPDTLSKYHLILKTLREDRLVFWDRESQESYHEFCRAAVAPDDGDEN